MIEAATATIYAEKMLLRSVPQARTFMAMMNERPHVRTMMADRAAATTVFTDLNVAYDG